MTYISASRLPALPAAPDASKPAPAPAASPAQTTPAASVDLSAAAKKLLGTETNNVPWGNSPAKD